jgi:hypothetical protein
LIIIDPCVVLIDEFCTERRNFVNLKKLTSVGGDMKRSGLDKRLTNFLHQIENTRGEFFDGNVSMKAILKTLFLEAWTSLLFAIYRLRLRFEKQIEGDQK